MALSYKAAVGSLVIFTLAVVVVCSNTTEKPVPTIVIDGGQLVFPQDKLNELLMCLCGSADQCMANYVNNTLSQVEPIEPYRNDTRMTFLCDLPDLRSQNENKPCYRAPNGTDDLITSFFDVNNISSCNQACITIRWHRDNLTFENFPLGSCGTAPPPTKAGTSTLLPTEKNEAEDSSGNSNSVILAAGIGGGLAVLATISLAVVLLMWASRWQKAQTRNDPKLVIEFDK